MSEVSEEIMVTSKVLDIPEVIPGAMAETYLGIPKDWYEWSETELCNYVKPTETDWALRYRFWVVYDEFCNPAHKRFRNIKIHGNDIFPGICSKTHWYDRLVYDLKKVAFITRPLESWVKANELALAIGGKRLFQLVTMDILEEDGQTINVPRARLMLDAIRESANRVHGLAVQKNYNLNVNKGSSKGVTPDEVNDPIKLTAKIAELEAKLNPPQLSPVIDAEEEAGDDGTE